MNEIAVTIIKLKWLIIAISIGLTLFFGYHIIDLEIDSDITALPDDDPVAQLYKDVGKEFGGNDIGLIIIETDNVFKQNIIEYIKIITDSVKAIEGVSTVTSLTKIIDIKGSEWGIEIGKLVDEYNLPNSEAELNSLKNRVFSEDMYKGTIVSEDSTSALIMFTLLDEADKEVVAKNVREKILGLNIPEKIYFGGEPFMLNDLSKSITTDIIKLIPFTFLLISLLLFLSFRSFRGVVLPMLTATLSVIWLLGTISLLGYKLTMISNSIPVILLAVGSGYTIHVINRINAINKLDQKNALTKSLAYIIMPVFLSALTTVVGFLSFVFGAYLEIIRDFGIFTALGVVYALLLSILFVPSVISIFSMKIGNKKINNEKKEDTFLKNYVLLPLNNLVIRYPKYILTIWGVAMLISISGIFLIEREVGVVKNFKEGTPTRLTEDILQKKFGGSLPVFIVFYGDVQSPAFLQMLKKTGDYMKKFEGIDQTLSVANLIEKMNDVMGEGKKIPKEKAKIEQLWFLLEGQEIMPQIVSDELDKAIVQSKFASSDSEILNDFILYMESFVDKYSTEEIKIELTGLPSIYSELDKNLINSQRNSIIIAIIMVLLIVGSIMRSPMKGLFDTLPIIATITILYGFMGFTGIPLDIATVLVASIALGIGIDYSIHVITHFNSVNNYKQDLYVALEETILISGKAIVINALSVVAGFLVLLFSQMVPLQNFGILVALCMVGSSFGSLTLLPTILILYYKKK